MARSTDITTGWGGRSILNQTDRALARVNGGAELDVARVNARGVIQAAQVDCLSEVTQRGLQGAAFISQVEQQLAQAVPLSASRLEAIGNVGALGLSQIVMDTANKLRRI